MNSRVDDAVKLFMDGYNCAQAVAGAFAERFGMDKKQVMRLVQPLGAGIGRQREVCGAVTGMCAVLGMAEGSDVPDAESKKAVYEATRALCGEFREQNGSIICRELLGLEQKHDQPTPAKRTKEYYAERPCANLCATAAAIFEEHYLQK